MSFADMPDEDEMVFNELGLKGDRPALPQPLMIYTHHWVQESWVAAGEIDYVRIYMFTQLKY